MEKEIKGNLNAIGPIFCRPALPRDRSAVMDFLADIWNGEDYVPEVWDRWLFQEPGLLAVAELAGEVLGLGHLVQMGSGEWWLEGLRVHTKARGVGIGSHLHDYFVNQWEATDGYVVRLATHSSRTSVHAMCERTGFQQISGFKAATAMPSKDVDGDILKPLDQADRDEAILAIRNSQACQALGGLMDYGWRFAEPRLDRLGAEDWLLNGVHGDFHLLRMERTKRELTVYVLATSAPQQRLKDELRFIRGWAAHHGAGQVDWLLPSSEGWLEIAFEADFETSDGEALMIFERRR